MEGKGNGIEYSLIIWFWNHDHLIFGKAIYSYQKFWKQWCDMRKCISKNIQNNYGTGNFGNILLIGDIFIYNDPTIKIMSL